MTQNPNITEGDLVVVYWYDTEDDSSWEKIELIKLMKAPLAKTYGLYLSEDDNEEGDAFINVIDRNVNCKVSFY